MVSETDTGTLQRLLRGNHSLCQGLRAQGLWCSTNNTNGAMREKTRREGMSGGKKKGWKDESKLSKTQRMKSRVLFICPPSPECFFTAARTECARESDRAEDAERVPNLCMHARETAREQGRLTMVLKCERLCVNKVTASSLCRQGHPCNADD